MGAILQSQLYRRCQREIINRQSNKLSKRIRVWRKGSVLHPVSQRITGWIPIAAEPAASTISNSEHILSQTPMEGVETILGFLSMRLPRATMFLGRGKSKDN